MTKTQSKYLFLGWTSRSTGHGRTLTHSLDFYTCVAILHIAMMHIMIALKWYKKLCKYHLSTERALIIFILFCCCYMTLLIPQEATNISFPFYLLENEVWGHSNETESKSQGLLLPNSLLPSAISWGFLKTPVHLKAGICHQYWNLQESCTCWVPKWHSNGLILNQHCEWLKIRDLILSTNWLPEATAL